ncbi:MAG TPA: reverse transcriptase family protein, partial [Gemmataceae bacterium]|nr:reverse transcriptase family protein [Gemmataceae bacterium]
MPLRSKALGAVSAPSFFIGIYMIWLGLFCVLPVLLIIFVGDIFTAYEKFRGITNNRPWRWFKARRGWGMNVEELARRLGMNVDELQNLEPRYTETFIPKKRGGTRRLLVPQRDLNAAQRRILHRLLGRLRAHPACTGFEKGKSIVHNAIPHVGRRVVIKMDIVDFFPTTQAKRIEWYFRRIGWNAATAALLTRLCTHEGALPQGAPTSPRLANLVNYMVDSRIDRFVRRRKGSYTRYADDITISFPKDYPRRVRGAIQVVRRAVKRFGYRIHTRGKLRVLRPHQRQVVTGLVVNAKVQLPRKQR